MPQPCTAFDHRSTLKSITEKIGQQLQKIHQIHVHRPNSSKKILDWINGYRSNFTAEVNQVSLSELEHWHYEKSANKSASVTGDLSFFSKTLYSL